MIRGRSHRTPRRRFRLRRWNRCPAQITRTAFPRESSTAKKVRGRSVLLKMHGEELLDASPGVGCRRGLRADSRHPEQGA